MTIGWWPTVCLTANPVNLPKNDQYMIAGGVYEDAPYGGVLGTLDLWGTGMAMCLRETIRQAASCSL